MSNTEVHAEYILIRQGKHTGYRFGSDRNYNADSYLFKNAAQMLDFATEKLHPDSVKAIRAQAAEYISRSSAKPIHCPNCGALAGVTS